MSPEEIIDPVFEKLLQYLKSARGFDFTEYKRASLIRRVNKRMGEVDIEGYEEYQDYLEVHPQEFTELFNTILINVTSFFRDQAAWDYLAEEIVPHLLEDKTPNSTIRLWSAGCASGEEAYSLTILMAEAMGLEACRRQVKIYATDVDEEDLEKARRGAFNEKTIEKIPEKLREKYFDKANNNGRYVFRQDLRRTLVFGRHDLMHDAPISRLDLLLCRNTLIYFNREAQERIVARFHFALKDSGFLFLGRAETMLTYGNLFEPENMKHRTFRKVSTAGSKERVENLVTAGTDIKTDNLDADIQIQRAAFESTPVARIVIDYHGDLTMANEEARIHLGLDLRDLGRPFRDLELSYRPLELRGPIDQAREERRSIVIQDVERALPDKDGLEHLDVTVTPLWGSGRWLGTAICFADATERQELKFELEQVRHDLETTYEELQSTNEELETSNGELQSTVEELQTTNEELQSSNEEMETMNEELQSSNSELQAMNDQLRHRTTDLNRVNAFLESILASVDVAVVVIDREFKVSLWNERAEDLWGLRSNEVLGQSLLDLDIGLPVADLREPVERFLAGEAKDEKIELKAVNRRGKTIKCYVTRTIRLDEDGDPEGVVLLMEESSE
ncbi:MAG: CheR family methyltransferase [Anaerolineales bacterium]|jgi:two-component system CheB/CheR fusion protein